MPSNITYSSLAHLPQTLALFPLPGALLLPRGHIPLNIFEPRYLQMIDDALAGDRLIGMIQPMAAGSREPVNVYRVGCAGRITHFAESGDGRYLIQLTGVARFALIDENTSTTPYRRGRIDFSPYQDDLVPRLGEDAVDRGQLMQVLRAFSKTNQIDIDWASVEQAPNEALVNALSMMAPFGAKEKQALLEAADLKSRAEILVALSEFELARKDTDAETAIQ